MTLQATIRGVYEGRSVNLYIYVIQYTVLHLRQDGD